MTVKFGYDAASNRKTMTDPQNLPTTYGYDVLNRLSSLAFNGQSPAFGFVYDALNRRTSLTRPNAVNTTYTYDPASSLLSALHKKNNQTLDGATYTYDNVENRKTRQDNRTSWQENKEGAPLLVIFEKWGARPPAAGWVHGRRVARDFRVLTKQTFQKS